MTAMAEPASVVGPAGGSLAERLRTGGPHLSVGMLTADLLRLGAEMELLAGTGIQLVHIDVMDGVFCPQITVGPPIVKALRGPLLRDVHLMIDDPLPKVDSFVAAGADMITFHLEGASQPHRVLQALRVPSTSTTRVAGSFAASVSTRARRWRPSSRFSTRPTTS